MHVYMYVQQDHKPLVQNPPSWDSKSRDLLLMRCDEDELPAMQSKLHLDMIILHVISRIGIISGPPNHEVMHVPRK